jgi:hypothetical protein
MAHGVKSQASAPRLDASFARSPLEDLASRLRLSGWDAVSWPYEAEISGELPPEAHSIARDAHEALERSGYVVIRIPWLAEDPADVQASVVTCVCALTATPLRVFLRQPLWRPLRVDPSRPPHRSGGVGVNPLHMDFVNAAQPPDYVYLYCVRPDPLGGGRSTLARFSGIEGRLSPAAREVLSRPLFRYGQVADLAGVGADINPFAVLPSNGKFRFRYSTKLLDATRQAEALRGLRAVDRQLARTVTRVELKAGDLLVIDQHRALHGREALGVHQESLPAGERRLLMHGFGRSRDSSYPSSAAPTLPGA